jgi:glycosyltransferase involved in cell wall biosynthesis
MSPATGGHRRVVVSHNTLLGEGGQGAHLEMVADALAGHFELTGFAREPQGRPGFTRVPQAASARILEKVPILRRRRDWQVLIEETSFDRRVAPRLKPASMFHGVAGQSALSLRRAAAMESATIVDALNPHVDHFAVHDERECAWFGVRPLVHPRLRGRMRAEYELADVVRVESQFSRRTFVEHGHPEERVVAIPPAVDPSRFEAADFGGPTFRVLFVGLFQPWKGFRYLVDAFERAQIPDSELILWGGVGSRAIKRYLAAVTQRNPAIKVSGGNLRDLGYRHAYGGASVLAHPSLAEGWGYAVTEAMASGLPVIVTSWTGASEAVEEGRNGYIVPPADVDALAERLVHLARHPALLRELGQHARKTACARTPRDFAADYRALVAAVLQEASG